MKTSMLKILFSAILLFMPVAVFSQAPQVIQVPVRCLGGALPADLTLADFEITEDGKPQFLQGLYFVEKNQIIRREERKNFSLQPNTTRHFYLLFQMTQYDAKLEQVVNELFREIIRPSDTLTLMTPMKVYSLNQQTFRAKPLDQTCKEMKRLLRKDIDSGSSEYNSLIKDLRRLVKAIQKAGGAADDQSKFEPEMDSDASLSNLGLELTLSHYRTSMEKLEGLRLVEEQKFLRFAEGLRNLKGQKIIFFFYQREFRPEINPYVLSNMMSTYQDEPNIMADLMDLFQFYKRETRLNVERLSQAFADASICLNFIFMEKAAQYIFGATMREQSEDVFSVFTQIAKATGGISDNSLDLSVGFQRAAQAVENYYLLCYIPLMYVPDGQFKTIRVTVKNRFLGLSSRLGYFSR